VHRDIKPSNILIGAEDEVKIVDFGLAWAQKRVGSRLTRSGLLIGTPEYMAPELIQADEADHRVDIYSVGIMLYEMLSGKKPYAGENPVRILFQHLEGDQVPLQQLVPNLKPEVLELVVRCMAREPGNRPADVRELRALLHRALESSIKVECEDHG
jgi:serine/threonine-protein kinase